MDRKNLASKISYLLRQRNIIGALLILMVVSNVILSLKLMSKEQITVLVPSEMTDSYRLNGGKVSDSYLIDRSSEIIKTIFNATPQNIDFMQDAVLKTVYPSNYSQVKKQLMELSEMVRQRRVTTVYFPTAIKVDTKELTAEIDGYLSSYLGRVSSSEHKIYHLKFINTGVKLALLEFYEVENAVKSDNDNKK